MNKKEKNKTSNSKIKFLKTTLVDFFEIYCIFLLLASSKKPLKFSHIIFHFNFNLALKSF